MCSSMIGVDSLAPYVPETALSQAKARSNVGKDAVCLFDAY